MVGVRIYSVLSALVGLALVAQPAAAIEVRSDFEGGSARLEAIDQDACVVRLSPAPNPGHGWTCWWYAQISGLTAGQRLTLDVGGGSWATPDRAVFSTDNRTWQMTEPGVRSDERIVYQLRPTAATVWVAWGPPYGPREAQMGIEAALKATPAAKAFELCKSKGNRPVVGVQIAEATTKLPAVSPQRLGIWLQARQHAWESPSSWVSQGFLDWLVSEAPEARTLRQRAKTTIVPIVDLDNVVRGAGGKEEYPQDHNRDWRDNPYWPATKASMKAINTAADEGRFDVFIDLHSPSAATKQPFFYVAPRSMLTLTRNRNLDRFLLSAGAEIEGPLNYTGLTYESGPAYDRQWQQISKNWVSLNTTAHVVAITLETPWNSPQSTQQNYLRLGRELGEAVERYTRYDNRRIERAAVIEAE